MKIKQQIDQEARKGGIVEGPEVEKDVRDLVARAEDGTTNPIVVVVAASVAGPTAEADGPHIGASGIIHETGTDHIAGRGDQEGGHAAEAKREEAKGEDLRAEREKSHGTTEKQKESDHGAEKRRGQKGRSKLCRHCAHFP